MSKQITAAELAEIVKKLLVDMDSAGELASCGQYQNFMTDIAQVVCDHCGGEIHHPAADLEDVWYIGIHGNDSLPENGGIWAGYDKDGELFEPDSEEDDAGYASQVEQRDIFTEALQANFISTSMTEREEIIIRRDLAAQEILERYPSETLILRELYDADTVFGECLNWMHDLFEFPNWEGRMIGDFLENLGIPGEYERMNVIQYRTRQANKEGVSMDNITIQQLRDSSPLGETGWMLPSGLELWFHQNIKN